MEAWTHKQVILLEITAVNSQQNIENNNLKARGIEQTQTDFKEKPKIKQMTQHKVSSCFSVALLVEKPLLFLGRGTRATK